MNARFHPSSAGQADGTTALVPPGLVSGPADQACCCVARAVVRVVMPPGPDRPHETELLLCGHHYRASRRALAAARARVEELPGSFGDDTAWFHGDRGRSVHAAVATR
jgi:hypothetical protein